MLETQNAEPPGQLTEDSILENPRLYDMALKEVLVESDIIHGADG
jgi:hypothetical protein